MGVYDFEKKSMQVSSDLTGKARQKLIKNISKSDKKVDTISQT